MQCRAEASGVICYLQVAPTGSMHAECPASKTKPQSSLSHTNLQSLQSIPEEQPELQSCSRVGAASTSVQAQASALLREKFPEPTQYIASSLQHRSPQGSCDLPTVFSGQLMMPVLWCCFLTAPSCSWRSRASLTAQLSFTSCCTK